MSLVTLADNVLTFLFVWEAHVAHVLFPGDDRSQ